MERFSCRWVWLLCSLSVLLLGYVSAGAATIWVDSLADDGTGGCTLREAVAAANDDTGGGGCLAGSGYDSIYFSVTGVIQLVDEITVTGNASIVGPNRSPDAAERTNPVVIKAAADKRALIFDSPGNDGQFGLVALTITGPDTGQGGGVHLSTGDSLNISTCVLKNCRWPGGGAVHNDSGQWLFIDASILAGNSATASSGGAVYSNATLRMDNCTVSGNVADVEGGGVYCSGNIQFNENTFSGNRAGVSGGALSVPGTLGSKTIRNSIYWGNSASADPEIAYTGDAPAVTYSDVAGGWLGIGNITSPPLFVLGRSASLAPTTAGNYHLKKTSPCVNAGTEPTGNGYDIDGDIRFQDKACDIGSDEAGPPFNDSFEYGTAIPAPWVGGSLEAGDRRVTGIRHLGRSSFRILGSPVAKYLKQQFPITGGQYYDIELCGWSRADGPSADGGAYRLEAVVFYNDGTTGRLLAPFSRATHGWEYRSRVLSAKGDFHKIILYLRYADQTGTAWFDDIKLSVYK